MHLRSLNGPVKRCLPLPLLKLCHWRARLPGHATDQQRRGACLLVTVPATSKMKAVVASAHWIIAGFPHHAQSVRGCTRSRSSPSPPRSGLAGRTLSRKCVSKPINAAGGRQQAGSPAERTLCSQTSQPRPADVMPPQVAMARGARWCQICARNMVARLVGAGARQRMIKAETSLEPTWLRILK